MTVTEVAYRCGLPVAMVALAAGMLATLGGVTVAATVAGQVVLGRGKYGRVARAHGLHGWRR